MIQLQVQNMHCGHCVAAITKAVQALDAAATVQIDLASKTVSIVSTSSVAQLQSAISAAGFPVSSAA